MIEQEIIDALFDQLMDHMQGMIVLWSGTIATIPDGWQLCDGTNGTPDLRNRFVACAYKDTGGFPVCHLIHDNYSSGGTVQHTHTFDTAGHRHEASGTYNVDSGTEHPVWDADGQNRYTTFATDSGTTYNQANPAVPFYALAYIMKI